MASQPDKVICKKCRLEFDGQALFCPNCGTARALSAAGEASGDPLVGTTVGDRYHLVERIGQGASGTIYRGEHVTLRRRVAVKVLHHELSRDDLAIERFRREATTVGEIENDHIVEIHDFGRTDDGRLYLAMEHLEGETLAEVLGREGRLSVEKTVDVLVQLGEALMEAHAIGYVHRDLRPRNLFLARRRSRKNYLKLLDFGLAKLVEQEGEAASTSLGMTFGDPHYMSPEQAKGNPVDRRADIYSMGCIAFEMLTGAPPFTGEKVFDVLTRHVEEPAPDLLAERPDVPAWLAGAVMRCLAKRPDERFITVYRLIEALRQGSDSGAIMADDVARRRESEPPPSVSQAMAKLGRRDSTLEGHEDLGRAETAADPRGAAPTSMPTPVPGSGRVQVVHDGPTEPSAAPALDAGRGDEARAAGKPERAAAPGISGAWFADGEAIGGHGDLAESDRAKLAQARGQTPSNTGILAAAGDDDDEYFDEPPARWPKIAAITGALAAVAILAALLWPSGDGGAADGDEAVAESEPAPAAEPEPEPTAAVVPAADAAAAAPEPGTDEGSDETAAEPEPERAAATDDDDASERERERERQAERERRQRERQAARDAERERQRQRETSPDPEPDQPDEPVTDTSGPSEGDDSAQPASDEAAKKAEFYARLGQRALANGDILGAATNFNKATELDARNADAIAGLGEIALSQGVYRAATSHFEKALRLRPRSSRLHTLLGETQLGAGNLQAAEKSFKQALVIDPDNARARDGYNEAVGLVGP